MVTSNADSRDGPEEGGDPEVSDGDRRRSEAGGRSGDAEEEALPPAQEGRPPPPLGDATTRLIEAWFDDQDGRRDAALERLLELHLEWLHQRVERALGPSLRRLESVEDIVQEALLSFLRYGPPFRPANGRQFRALLFRIILNTIRGRNDWWQRRRREFEATGAGRDGHVDLTQVTDGAPGPADRASRAEMHNRVWLALELMSPERRDLIVARDWDHQPYSRITAEFDIGHDAARMRCTRARKELVAILRAMRHPNSPRFLEWLEGRSKEPPGTDDADAGDEPEEDGDGPPVAT